MREPHSHRCPECRGEWTHEGRCADGRLAWCPSCSPESDSSSARPRERGPHVHCCSACRQTWRHATSCDAPLRATLPDCPGCRKRGSETQARPSKATVVSRHRRRRARRRVVGPVAVPVFVLALATLLAPWRFVRIPLEGMLAVRAPISILNARAPGRVESAPKESAQVGGWSAATLDARLRQQGAVSSPPDAEVSGPDDTQIALSVTPLSEPLREGIDPASPQSESGTPPTPVRSATAEQTGAVASLSTTSPVGAGAAGAEDSGAAASARSPSAPSQEQTAAPITRSPGVSSVPPKSLATESSLTTAKLSIPGAPPVGSRGAEGISYFSPGGLAGMVSRVGHQPRRWTGETAALGQPQPDPKAPAAESPRRNAALIPALTRAVVYVQAWKQPAAPGRPMARPVREPQEPPGRRDRGFVVDGRGYVLTNEELVRGATVIEVTLHDGRRLAAALVAQDPLNGVAVLKVKVTGLPAIALGDSQALTAGEPVLVIGDRRGSDPTLTVATIRATGAATGGNLAVDLPVSRQGSGGPLLNRFGQAVGIVIDSAGETPTLTFAVPIDRVKPILRRLATAPSPAVALGPER